MLQLDVYDWSNVPEPSEADLSEIDAAIAAAPPIKDCAPFTEWLNTTPVRLALASIWPCDGTEAWNVAFLEALLRATDTLARIRVEHDDERLAELASQYRQAREPSCERGDGPLDSLWVGDGMDTRQSSGRSSILAGMGTVRVVAPIVAEMVEILPIPALARYLGESEATVEKLTFRVADVKALRVAARLHVDHRLSVGEAAARAHVDDRTLLRFLRAWDIQSPIVISASGKTQLPSHIRERMAVLEQEGLKPSAIFEALKAEFPATADVLKLNSVQQFVYRKRATRRGMEWAQPTGSRRVRRAS